MEITPTPKNNPLPDVASESSLQLFSPLNWVGMSDISLPVMVELEGRLTTVPARVDAQVSLDLSSSRGIHMSRLYTLVQEYFSEKALSMEGLTKITNEFLSSHKELSSSSRLRVRMEIPVRRTALKSGHKSWRTYPVAWKVENRNGKARFWFEVEIAYSSTCPASAALSRQLIQENFKAHFANEEIKFEDIHHWLGTTQGILATPHAQRSYAQVGVELESDQNFNLLDLINLVEDALQTPVQTLVKREDEQEFARRNGQNLMFCEDAARRIQSHLNDEPSVQDYWIHVNHQESLHPHNAVAFLSKTPQSHLKATW
jgi:GTP cyclohydrolase I